MAPNSLSLAACPVYLIKANESLNLLTRLILIAQPSAEAHDDAVNSDRLGTKPIYMYGGGANKTRVYSPNIPKYYQLIY